MALNEKQILAILEREAMRHRAMARLSELAAHHLQTAEALETALRLIKTCPFDGEKGN